MTSDRNSLRRALIERFPRERAQLLPALHYLHEEFGHLPEWAMEVVGWHLGIPASEVYGAATSYTELRISEPAGHVLRVCTGVACRASGGNHLLDGVEMDGFAVEQTPCGFLCSLAPVAQVDGVWRGRLTPESLRSALSGEATA